MNIKKIIREELKRVLKEDLLTDKSKTYRPGYDFMVIDNSDPTDQLFFRSRNGAVAHGKSEIGSGFSVFKLDLISRL